MTRSCPLVFFLALFLALFLAPPPAAAEPSEVRLEGVVVDAADRPVPRARVRVIDGEREIALVFADERGRFVVDAGSCAACRVEVSLGGFRPSLVPAGGAGDLKVVLAVAPIEESITVTATRGEAPTGQLGASVTIVDRADIERARTARVADLLRLAPGATVVRQGGVGTLATLFVRGGETNHNKVLLDGVPLNEPGGFFNFGTMTTEDLERIEIVRGAHSALFGSDAVASVVHLVTRRPQHGRPAISLAAEGGTYASSRVGAGIAGAAGRADYAFHAARARTDNRGANSAFGNTTVSASAGAGLGPRATLRLTARGELGRVGTPGGTAFGRPDLDAFFRRRDGAGGVTLDHELASAWRQRWTYGLSVTHQQSTNLAIDPPFTPAFGIRTAPFTFVDFPYDSRTDLRRHHLAHQSDWRVPHGAGGAGEHLLTFVFDWDGERGVLGDRLEGSSTRASRDNFGWSFQHQALWRRAFVTTGVRIEDNDSFGASVVPRVSAALVARQAGAALGETKLKATFGLGIKEPGFLQSFSRNPSFLGNPDLDPERSRSFDAGIEQRFLGGRAKADATWFENRFRNLISTATTSFNPFRSQYVNIGRTSARGLELGLEAAPLPALRARGVYTFLLSRVVQSTSSFSPVFAEGRWLFRRPRHSGSLQVFWDHRAVGLTSTIVVVGRRVDSDFSALEPPIVANEGYVTWDLAASYRMSARARWFVAIENLANREYMDPLGFPQWRRSVRAGLTVDLPLPGGPTPAPLDASAARPAAPGR